MSKNYGTTEELERIIISLSSYGYTGTLDCYPDLTANQLFLRVNEGRIRGLITEETMQDLFLMERQTVEQYYQELRSGERSHLPWGIFLNRKNNGILVDICLAANIEGYDDASREEKIKHIRREVIEYQHPEAAGKNGSLQYLRDHGLGGMLQQSPHFKKKGSPKEAFVIYNDVCNLHLFDRDREIYLGQWEIPAVNMWQGAKGKLLVAEAIDDVLRWNIPGYRNASRNERVKLIKCIFENSSRARDFFVEHGLYGMVYSSQHFKKKSIAEAFRVYDEVYQLKLFDSTLTPNLLGVFVERK